MAIVVTKSSFISCTKKNVLNEFKKLIAIFCFSRYAEYQFSILSDPDIDRKLLLESTSKALAKDSDFTVTFEEFELKKNDEESSELTYITSPWSTKCLVYNNFLYNCHSSHANKICE
jgi:hypothetical protein